MQQCKTIVIIEITIGGDFSLVLKFVNLFDLISVFCCFFINYDISRVIKSTRFNVELRILNTFFGFVGLLKVEN